MKKIPFVDLYAQYLNIKTDIDSAICNVIKTASFIGGKEVKQFEEAFAAYLNVNNCISCANGTDSLEILLKAYGIGQGDEVIVPAISWISTSEAVSNVGAKPVFVDIHPEFYTIDSSKIVEKISGKTKAIIPVHLYGHPCNMDEIMSVSSDFNLIVIEDCAQSHGAMWNGTMVGTIGNAGSFSFYPGKNIGAYGDAGAMVTNDDNIAKICRQISNHGQEGKHNHLIEGRNSRLDGIQAAILKVKLPHLNGWTKSRRQIAQTYSSMLSDLELQIPLIHENAQHVFHLYVIRIKNRDAMINFLNKENIEVSIHYPKALPFLSCYKDLLYKPEDFPIAYQYQSEIVSLPIYAELTDDSIRYIVEQIKRFLISEKQ